MGRHGDNRGRAEVSAAAPAGAPAPTSAQVPQDLEPAFPAETPDPMLAQLAAERDGALAQLAEREESHRRLHEARADDRRDFDRAWAEREEEFAASVRRLTAGQLVADGSLPEGDLAADLAALADAPALPPSPRLRAAASIPLFIDGVRIDLRPGDLIPEGADLSGLPAWATEEC